MTSSEIQFRGLELESGWRQFDDLSIAYDARLTVLTGANASGKTTLLALLAKHFNWSRSYSSAPMGKGGRKWGITVRRVARPEAHVLGRLMYSDGSETPITVPAASPEARTQYDVQFPAQRPVAGVFLTSHRAVAGNYAPVATIPALFGSSEQLFEQFTNEVRTRWLGSWTGKTPQQALKESLIAAAVFGEGSQSVDRNPDAWEVWKGFQRVLAAVLPPSLGFHRLRIRVPEVIVETRTGDFILDEASGGLSSLMEMAWQIFLRSRNMPQFTVLIDEPENHLHPSLQREILPSLLRAFPRVQFIVATHSPFVVTATPDSTVYVLEYNERRRVVARSLDYANKAASADDTLRRVLGLDSTMPVWAEQRFREILEEYLTANLTTERLAALRDALSQNGLESEFPSALLEASDRYEPDAN